MLRLLEIDERHFWFVGRRDLVLFELRRHVPRGGRVLDAGCGTGTFLDALRAEGYRAVGLDSRPEGLVDRRNASADIPLARGDVTRLPFAARAFDAVVLLDVLEHVDDRALLAEVERVLVPGGWVLVTTPAFGWLWSHRDDAAGHLRRYTRRSLEPRIRAARLSIERVQYYQFLLFALVFGARLWGRRTPRARDFEDLPAPAVNAIFSWVNRLEVRLGRSIRWPWGSSLVVVCRKTP